MLARRSQGLGSTLTTSPLRYAREAAAALCIPGDITQSALTPVAYLTGTGLHPARRVAARGGRRGTPGASAGDLATVAPRHALHTERRS
jgi:hypothetical protein